jgi:hypothetical protein
MLGKGFRLPVQVDAEQHSVARYDRSRRSDFAAAEQQLQRLDVRLDADEQDHREHHRNDRHDDVLAAAASPRRVGDEWRDVEVIVARIMLGGLGFGQRCAPWPIMPIMCHAPGLLSS